MFIDAHAHIFPEVKGLNREGPTRGVGYGRVALGHRQIQVLPPLCRETIHTAEMLIMNMDYVGVDKAVLLQGPFYGECNYFVCEAVRSHPDRLIGFAYLDPWGSESRSFFEGICSRREFVGVKIEFSEATGLCGLYPGARLDDPYLEWLWAELEHQGMVLVLDLGAVASASYQTSAVRTIAVGHPELTIVIAHLAQPTPAAKADRNASRLWREQVELGLLSNVYFDTASLPAYVGQEDFPFATAGGYMREVISCIGPNKVMWGTDIPALLSVATYKQLLGAAQMQLSCLPESARAQVLGQNAMRIFRRTRTTVTQLRAVSR